MKDLLRCDRQEESRRKVKEGAEEDRWTPERKPKSRWGSFTSVWMWFFRETTVLPQLPDSLHMLLLDSRSTSLIDPPRCRHTDGEGAG